ncbi:MAG: class I SAM-dependent methyltransferase [Eubacteriales bacterium]
MSSYGVFANFYDELTSNVEYEKRAEYFRTLLSQYRQDEGTLLDLACGTGSLILQMASFGYDVIGVDSSPDMLSIAQHKAFEAEQTPLLLCQKMQMLDLYGTIDAAICALDSINHLTQPKDVKETFRRVSLFLNPSGVFIFDVNTVFKHKNILANNVFVYDFDDLYCVWQNRLDEKINTVKITLEFFEEDDGAYYRSTETFAERAYSYEELSKWLTDAGFEVMNIFEELTQTPPKEDTQRAVFVARKG